MMRLLAKQELKDSGSIQWIATYRSAPMDWSTGVIHSRTQTNTQAPCEWTRRNLCSKIPLNHDRALTLTDASFKAATTSQTGGDRMWQLLCMCVSVFTKLRRGDSARLCFSFYIISSPSSHHFLLLLLLSSLALFAHSVSSIHLPPTLLRSCLK